MKVNYFKIRSSKKQFEETEDNNSLQEETKKKIKGDSEVNNHIDIEQAQEFFKMFNKLANKFISSRTKTEL